MNTFYFPRYLDLLPERLAEEERPEFLAALAQMRNVNVEEADLRRSEAVVLRPRFVQIQFILLY
jgi:hypothetical protein